MRILLLIVLVLTTWVFQVFHRATLVPPISVENPPLVEAHGTWYDQKDFGVHHIFLKGTAYERGYAFGKLTEPILHQEEKALFETFEQLFPSRAAQIFFAFLAGQYFVGIDHLILPSELEEMYGILKSASADLNFLVDPYTRQLALHGLHEVGQMMVDTGFAAGCIVAILPGKESFLLGRNFDFEASRIVDDQKVVKWVYPEAGIPYVSVIWAGMTSALTAVNQAGIWISLNAAGTTDYARIGVPTTLVALRILENARTLDDALRILNETPTFISEIFIVAEAATNRIVQVEKTPERISIAPLERRAAVANHLMDPQFSDDSINAFRRDQQTSTHRFERALELVQKAPANASPEDSLAILRDKSAKGDRRLPIGNRGAIDAGIAVHATIWDAGRSLLYVSRGPALSEEFVGYDLQKSFEEQRPIEVDRLPKDPVLPPEGVRELDRDFKALRTFKTLIENRTCERAEAKEASFGPLIRNHHEYWMAQGDYLQRCQSDLNQAREAWKKSLSLSPPYFRERESLTKRLESPSP